MKSVDASPLSSLCCELNPLMSESGKRVHYADDPDTYLELVPLKCRYCNQQVCEDCWNEGKHFIKGYKMIDGKDQEGLLQLYVKRDIPSCINPWRNMLLKAKAKL